MATVSNGKKCEFCPVYKSIIKPLFFTMQPEKVHHLSFKLLRGTLRIPGVKQLFKRKFVVSDPSLVTTVFGLDFPNPVGLAAGFDKDATLFNELEYIGFGFVEIGTVTPVGQPGNPQPRLFRLPKDHALINRMGFNNEGVDAAAERLKKRKTKIIIGGNIGKNKVTPNDQATEDYIKCFEALYPYVDYFVVNVSSPNTPNLRDLQEKGPLTALLNQLMDRNRTTAKPKPLLLKIAPDLTDGQLDDIVDIVAETKIDGVIASNTTIARSPLTTDQKDVEAIGMGGLSGAPVRARSTDVIRHLHAKSNGAFPIIGVGGISSAKDAIEKLEAGASLVQVYTGYIYEGPSLVANINEGIVEWKKQQFKAELSRYFNELPLQIDSEYKNELIEALVLYPQMFEVVKQQLTSAIEQRDLERIIYLIKQKSRISNPSLEEEEL